MKDNMSNIGNLFALSHDPVICAENGYITYMNPPAISLFGRDKLNMPAHVLFPENLLEITSESFVASANIQGQIMTVSRTGFMGQHLYSFILPVPEEEETAIHAVSSTMRELTNGIKTTSDLINSFSVETNNTLLQKYSAVLKHYAAKMKRLVNNYALFSSFKQGILKLSPVMASIGDICKEICAEVEEFTLPHNITLTYTLSSEIIASIDSPLISQLLLNLISNSLNNMPNGGQIRLNVSATSKYIILSVEDNGIGIPADVLVDVFKSYTKAIDLSSGSFTAGLGLSVADAIAKAHGGTLVIESTPNQGTRVIVQIPRIIDHHLMSPKAEYRIPMHEFIMTDLSTWLTWEDYLPN